MIRLYADNEVIVELPEIELTEKEDELIENNKTIDKGVAINRLAQILDIDENNIYAVGDEENDLPMIQYAGLGVAMENAVPFVKEAADFVTVGNEEHAIAKIISDLDQGKIVL